ncbi:unnamed protein product [Mucor hiemalis]
MIEDRKVLSRDVNAGPSVHSSSADTISNATNSLFTCSAIEAQAALDEIFPSASSACVDKTNFFPGYNKFSMLRNHHSHEVIEQNRVYVRVVKDIFHLMDMIKPYKRHGLYKEFTRRFSDSLFKIDEEDERKVKEALLTHGLSWDTKMKYDRNWIWKRSGRTLFDKFAWKQALSVLKTVQLGHASDPPGVRLYYKLGKKDKYGLDLYRCIRATNSLEGGVHQNLIRKFGSFGAGPELADAMLVEYRLRHNLDVGTMNRLGHKYNSHYDPWLIQHIDLLRRDLAIQSANVRHLATEVNALHYRGSKETFGICPIPFEEMDKLGIVKTIDAQSSPHDIVPNDLTIPKIKDTVYLQLGSTLRPKNARYIFQLPAIEWNLRPDGVTIFYETPEHVEQYYNHWKDQDLARKTHMVYSTVIEFFELKVTLSRQSQQRIESFAITSLVPVVNNSESPLSSDNFILSSIIPTAPPTSSPTEVLNQLDIAIPAPPMQFYICIPNSQNHYLPSEKPQTVYRNIHPLPIHYQQH